MTANFALSLTNPNAAPNPANTIYTNGAVGNTLVLTLANNFGFDLTFGGSSTGKTLQLTISANVMEEAEARSLTVETPWTLAFVPPHSMAPKADGWIFHLTPPAGGTPFPNGQSIAIALQNLRPSHVGTGQVSALYAFDSTPADDLNVSASLSVLAPYNPSLPALIGSGDALLLTPFVNGGDRNNPVMVSSTPVTPETAVDNLLRLNLTFQGNRSDLVSGWDEDHPPTFRISFPYFNGKSGLPAPLDLTDTLKLHDRNYNPLTSAWNFPLTFDPTDPNITNNEFWQITLDPRSETAPVWMVTPTPANPHLFTAGEGFNAAPGPVLDLYLLDIVSGLPINPANPETLLYFQWNDFPGFNDGSLVYPLQKTPLTISMFQGRIIHREGKVTVELNWETSGADHCLITGDTNELARCAPIGQPYHITVSVEQPLFSVYTLTAVSATGDRQVSRTISTKWQVNSDVTPISVNLCGPPSSVDGSLFFLPFFGSVIAFNIQTLAETNIGVTIGPSSIFPLALSPDGSSLYIASVLPAVYRISLPGIADMASAHVFAIALGVSPEGSIVAAITPDSTLNSSLPATPTATTGSLKPEAMIHPQGRAHTPPSPEESSRANQLWLLNSATMQPLAHSPVPLPGTPTTLTVSPPSGNYYITTCTKVGGNQFAGKLEMYDATTGQPTGNSMATDVIGKAAISPDGNSLYTLSTASAFPFLSDFYLSKIDLATMTYQRRISVNTAFVLVPEALQESRLPSEVQYSSLVLSPGGAYLFLCGVDMKTINMDNPVFHFVVYDTSTMQPVSWSLRYSANLRLMR